LNRDTRLSRHSSDIFVAIVIAIATSNKGIYTTLKATQYKNDDLIGKVSLYHDQDLK